MVLDLEIISALKYLLNKLEKETLTHEEYCLVMELTSWYDGYQKGLERGRNEIYNH